MAKYSDLVAAIAHQTQQREDALPVQGEASRSRFFMQLEPAAKVCLFFHGFTGVPSQFVPLAQTLFRAGYSVMIPRLPGHGQKGDWSRSNPTPLPTDPAVYQEFALHWFQQAQALGQEVVVGGLSGGGTMAAWLAVERPQQVHRALLFAPFLSSLSRITDLVIQYSDNYHEWPGGNYPERVGYGSFMFPALRVFLDLGSEVLNRVAKSAIAPTFVVSTEIDDSVSNDDHFTWFERATRRQPQSWHYRFNRFMNVPHTMMTVGEGNEWEYLLNRIAKAFVESDLSWSEVQEIAYQMTQGKTFDAVTQALQMGDRISTDLPTFITLLDKRAIVESRNPSLFRDGR